jgi:hypothetical protein
MQLRTKESLPPVERATLDALTETLRDCNAHMGGSAIGKGFRLAFCERLRFDPVNIYDGRRALIASGCAIAGHLCLHVFGFCCGLGLGLESESRTHSR